MDFFEEYRKLKLQIPRCALFNINSQNSGYCAYSRSNKNCYLCFGCDYNEDMLYMYWAYHSKDCVDCSYLQDCELCYECIDCRKCYNANFCQDCQNCSDSWFFYNCYGCSNCSGCVNLKQAQFHIFNKKFAKEEYFKELKKYTKLPYEEQKKLFAEFLIKQPRVYMRQFQNHNCSGDHVYNSKNCWNCYDVQNAEDCFYLSHCIKTKDCCDMDFIYDAELCYECISVSGFNCQFCYVCWECSDMEFCELCFNCKNCFGCVGLKTKSYHILNKSYPPDEYFKRVNEIKSQLKTQNKYNAALPQVFYEG